MAFLAPLMLLGGIAAAIPVLIHLTGRSRPRPVRFPSLRFIVSGQRRSTRVLTVKHWLLLLLRVSLPVLLALIFARPYLRDSRAFAGPSRVRADAVIVLDVSYSMAYSEAEQTRFARAQDAVDGILERLTPESRVGLILMADRPRAVVPRLTIDHDAVRGAARQAQVVWRATRYGESLSAAEKMLEDAEGPNQVIFLISDLTRAGFGARPTKKIRRSVRLAVLDVKQTPSRNGAVLGVELSAQDVSPGTPMTIRADVLPPAPDRDLLVALHLDGKKVDQRAAPAGGPGVRSVRFELTAPASGLHTGHVRLEADPLTEDNACAFAFQVSRKLRVLLVEAASPAVSQAAAPGFYLRLALAPDELLAGGLVRLTRIGPAALGPMPLAGYDAVLLASAAAVDPPSWQHLTDYVDGGGGLIVLPGRAEDAAALAPRGYDPFASAHGLLPGHIGAAAPAAEPAPIDLSDLSGPVLRAFRGGHDGEIRQALFQPLLDLTREPKDLLASAAVRLADGRILLMEKRFGRGRVLLASAGFTPPHSNLARLPCFVPWIHELVRHVAPRHARRESLRVGEAFEQTLPYALAEPDEADNGGEGKAATFELMRPGTNRWERRPLRRGGSALAKAGGPKRPPAAHVPTPPGEWARLPAPARGVIRVDDTDRPGLYRVRWRAVPAPDSPTLENAFPVVLDTEESDLTPVDEKRLRQLLERPALKIARDVPALLAGLAQAGRAEIGGWLWPLLVLALIAESLLSNRMYRKPRTGVGDGP